MPTATGRERLRRKLRKKSFVRGGASFNDRNLSTLHIQPRPSPLSRTIPKPLRVVGRIIDPMTLGSSRQLFLAPASAVLSPPEQLPNVQSMVYDGFHHQPRQQRAPVFKLAHKELSEEDEFDVDEVYRLLDESAGFRAEEMGSPRRRERLTNLSLEEKINRRKHKNRIAAQAARDRKKVNTHRLEESLRGALLEIGRLRGEVNLLRADNARLEAENQTIRFGQEKPGPGECGDNGTFQRHLMDESMLYEEHCLPQQQNSHRQFQHQSKLNRPLTADVKPSILVRPTGNGQQQPQPQQIGVIGQRDSKQRQSQRKAKMDGEEGVRDGMRGQSAHGVVAGGEDVELQKIFDELFEDFNFPVDVDRFCNEVIEEGIAEASDAFGAGQTGTAQQQPTKGGDGCVYSADETEAQGQSSAQAKRDEWVYRQQCGVRGGQQQQQQQHGVGRSAAVAAALSPHNYFLHSTPPAFPFVNAASVSTSSSESQQGSNGSSPTYQKVPSPCLSSHSTYIDEFASTFTDVQHQFIDLRRSDPQRDPLLCSVKQEYFGQFDDHSVSPSYGLVEEPIEWEMNNNFDNLGAEESCTLEEGPTMMLMSEDPIDKTFKSLTSQKLLVVPDSSEFGNLSHRNPLATQETSLISHRAAKPHSRHSRHRRRLPSGIIGKLLAKLTGKAGKIAAAAGKTDDVFVGASKVSKKVGRIPSRGGTAPGRYYQSRGVDPPPFNSHALPAGGDVAKKARTLAKTGTNLALATGGVAAGIWYFGGENAVLYIVIIVGGVIVLLVLVLTLLIYLFMCRKRNKGYYAVNEDLAAAFAKKVLFYMFC
uniref:X-box-binding protein 1 n=1 Tax=Globodera pallida TaxID=36090 RepID=A0A183C0X6_GLOPA